MKLEHQHRPLWGFIERHVVAIATLELFVVIFLILGFLHIQDLADWLMAHL